ncbi:MAG: hypothetical protein M0R70_09770 [Nitrospirae bacterium]|nr:hypothetical protein [Nitrospirota bacterium]
MIIKKRALKTLILAFIVLAAMSGGTSIAGETQVSATYLYTLSNSMGIVPFSWVKLSVDTANDEVYVVSSKKVSIFNGTGMEVYAFNESGDLGLVSDVAVRSNGDILALSSRSGRVELIRCNFRGEPIATIELKNLPAEYADFSANRIVIHGTSLYLANTNNMKVIVTDDAGVFQKGYNLAWIIEKELKEEGADERELEREKEDSGMTGFNVDAEGSMLFTSSIVARVYRVSLDGKMQAFGRRGSSPGKFGVPGDVVVDATGKYLLVSDILRCTILVFDKDFRFLTEFGIRGYRPHNIVGPLYMAVDAKNRVHVSQLRNRGVNVYQFSEL